MASGNVPRTPSAGRHRAAFTLSSLIRERPKTAAEVVQRALHAITHLESARKEKEADRANEEVAKAFGAYFC